MNKTFRNWSIATVLVLATVAAVLMYVNRARLPTYRAYMYQDAPAIEMRYAGLTAAMDEKAVRKHFNTVFLRCYTDAAAGGGLGDRICYADITQADGLPAMVLSAFFAEGKLTHTMLQVPWWRHLGWRDRLVSLYGKAERTGRISAFEGPVVRWTLPDGATIEFNRDQNADPLNWSTIFFTPGVPPVPAPAPVAAQSASEAPVAAPAAVTSAPKLPMPVL